jgi:hypothetical protein
VPTRGSKLLFATETSSAVVVVAWRASVVVKVPPTTATAARVPVPIPVSSSATAATSVSVAPVTVAITVAATPVVAFASAVSTAVIPGGPVSVSVFTVSAATSFCKEKREKKKQAR